ncbi:MAG: hypothetical protein LUE92_16700 [Clostridiales bacterium]|nr:hypothetical protein [Clostridiales bacterium]
MSDTEIRVKLGLYTNLRKKKVSTWITDTELDEKIHEICSCMGRIEKRPDGTEALAVPELTSELVKEISECETVAEYREQIREQMSEQKKEQARHEQELYLLEQVIANAEIYLPESVIEENIQIYNNNLNVQLERTGTSFEKYLEENRLNEEEFRVLVRDDTEKMLKIQAVLKEIARKEAFSYDDEELDREIKNMAESGHIVDARLREMLGEKGLKMLGEGILMQKAMNYLTERACQ